MILYVRGEMALAHDRLTGAVSEARDYGMIGDRVLGSEFSVEVVVHAGAGAYIVGEETALLTSLEGARHAARRSRSVPVTLT